MGEPFTHLFADPFEGAKVLRVHGSARLDIHEGDPTVSRFEHEVDLESVTVPEVPEVGADA